jgi:hypothetical protein
VLIFNFTRNTCQDVLFEHRFNPQSVVIFFDPDRAGLSAGVGALAFLSNLSTSLFKVVGFGLSIVRQLRIEPNLLQHIDVYPHQPSLAAGGAGI